MKTKYVITFLQQPKWSHTLVGAKIDVKIFQKKGLFSKWKQIEEVVASCTGSNMWEGYEWYIEDNGRRLRWSIEDQAHEQYKKMKKKEQK